MNCGPGDDTIYINPTTSRAASPTRPTSAAATSATASTSSSRSRTHDPTKGVTRDANSRQGGTLRGTERNDNLLGGPGPDTLLGHAGDDVLWGNRLHDGRSYGTDRIDAGPGNDTVYGSRAGNKIIGGDGDDFLQGGPLRNRILAGYGNDTVRLRGPGPNTVLDRRRRRHRRGLRQGPRLDRLRPWLRPRQHRLQPAGQDPQLRAGQEALQEAVTARSNVRPGFLWRAHAGADDGGKDAQRKDSTMRLPLIAVCTAVLSLAFAGSASAHNPPPLDPADFSFVATIDCGDGPVEVGSTDDIYAPLSTSRRGGSTNPSRGTSPSGTSTSSTPRRASRAATPWSAPTSTSGSPAPSRSSAAAATTAVATTATGAIATTTAGTATATAPIAVAASWTRAPERHARRDAPRLRRKVSTARIRRWSSSESGIPSFANSDPTCFCTTPVETPSRSAIPLLERPSAISSRTSRSRGVSVVERTLLAVAGEQLRDDLRVERGPAGRHVAQRGREVLDVGDAVLEQVAEARGVLDQDPHRDPDLDVLGEDHDRRVRVAGADLARRVEPLLRVGRRHPHVDDHDVGRVLVDRRVQLDGVGRLRRDLEPAAPQQRSDALADQQAVIGDHDSDNA